MGFGEYIVKDNFGMDRYFIKGEVEIFLVGLCFRSRDYVWVFSLYVDLILLFLLKSFMVIILLFVVIKVYMDICICRVFNKN